MMSSVAAEAEWCVSSTRLRDAVSSPRFSNRFRGVPQLQQVCQTCALLALEGTGLGVRHRMHKTTCGLLRRCCRPVQVRTTPDSVRETCPRAAHLTTVAQGANRHFVHSVDVTERSCATCSSPRTFVANLCG